MNNISEAILSIKKAKYFLCAEIEKEARKILQNNKNLKSFEMGFGETVFNDNHDKYVYLDERDDMLKILEIINNFPEMKLTFCKMKVTVDNIFLNIYNSNEEI